jgi:hypothetical protein
VASSASARLATAVALICLAGAGTAYAQSKPLELGLGYDFGRLNQGYDVPTVAPVGFSVEVARPYKETRHLGHMELLAQFQGTFGSANTDPNANENGSRHLFSGTVGARFTFGQRGSYAPFGEIKIGLCRYATSISGASFSNLGGGGELAGGIVFGRPSQGALRGYGIRGAVDLFGASGPFGNGGGISNWKIGAFVRFKVK